MAPRSKDKLRRDDLLAQVPAGAKFLQVKDEKGKIRYRAIEQLATGDEIQVNSKGQPIFTRSSPGRRKDVKILPATPEVGELMERKSQSLAADAIVKMATANPESPDVLHQILLALAEEAASIGFERKEAERQGTETSGISTRRVSVLKAIGDTWLKRKEQIAAREIDLNSPVFKTLFNFVMETFRDAMSGCDVRAEIIETVFSKFAKAVGDETWEAEARNRMKNTL